MDQPADNSIEPRSGENTQPQVFPTVCRYCGAQLHQSLYFCPACSTPFKGCENVLASVIPMPLSEAELIEKKAPNVMVMFWTFFSVLIGGSILCWLAFGEEELLWRIIVMDTLLFITTCIFTAMHWRVLFFQFRQIGFLVPAAWISLALLVPLLAINYGYLYFFIEVLGVPYESLSQRLFDAGMTEGGLILCMCVLPAVIEEIEFRGLIQTWLQSAIRPHRAILLTSALFTAVHFSILSAPYLFLVGLVLGWSRWKTRSLYPPMLIHFLHNFVVVMYFD